MTAAPRRRPGESPGALPGDLVLAVETSTKSGSVAIVSNEGLRVEIMHGLEATHSDHILGAVDQALRDTSISFADLTGLAVSAGPGSFTGLRIGLATVKGLAEAHPLPIVAVSTLEALAMNAPAGRTPVCPTLDARKGEVYGALFAWDGEAGDWRALVPEGAYAPESFARRVAGATEEALFLGDGAQVYADIFAKVLGKGARFAAGPAHQPRAAWVGWLGIARLQAGLTEDPVSLVPRYLRASEAELAWALREGGRG
ncbi:MAG: tRNA (adenosine(37)-N6)-threonylcarbamoyltransferase complex dimerization subunit type 1 TsaB [Deltaproteobacteria bacterium]|nr:tRNA (adenosine(37)-N6)-threonylcarbamoyltransferase complex dimerization subunit type 1 TsaB [Deltaproteobacteria bacterium]